MADISFDVCKCGSIIVSNATAVAQLKFENERLRNALVQAANDLDDWGAYTKANNARYALVVNGETNE